MGIFSKGKPARSEAPEFIEVGQIVNTHGVKGDVKVQPWDVTPAQLAGFKALYMDGTQFRPIDRRIQGDMVLMHFPGWDDMTAAETLKTKILSIKRSEVQLKRENFLMPSSSGCRSMRTSSTAMSAPSRRSSPTPRTSSTRSAGRRSAT